MKTITKTYEIYRYHELSEKASDRARQWYIEHTPESYFYTECCNEQLFYLFPESEVKVSYSLCYCQGDYFSIYGTLYLTDVLEQIQDKFTATELKFLNWIFGEFNPYYKLDEKEINYRHIYFTAELIDETEYLNYRNIKTEMLEKFDSIALDYLQGICEGYADDGYRYFYEPEEDEMSDFFEINDYWFTNEGEVF